MLKRLLLYGNTIKKMKSGQIQARMKKKLNLKVSLGVSPKEREDKLTFFHSPEDLDFDPVFIKRFNLDEFLYGKVTFLHETETINWNGKWDAPERTALWNFNLHYFEFLMLFVKAYKDSGDNKYLNVIEECIVGWIDNNPSSKGGNGWSAYTISLRLVYWFSCLFHLYDVLNKPFVEKMIASIYEQYVFLANHLEKDILANHYFENLKTLILCSIVFNDTYMLKNALNEFACQCKEQILTDGMHCELSPMYHKIILEALLRVAIALRDAGIRDKNIESYIQPMLDVAYSFEEGVERIPLFNDGGNNVAKSLNSLMCVAERFFSITPIYKSKFPESGYYIFKHKDWKMIVDAGKPGPKYNSGHAHCDAMSFELYKKGRPIIVNCGTFAYQCKERAYFRSTSAHNTTMVDGVEQSECWSVFRMGKESHIMNVEANEKYIKIHMMDQQNNSIHRLIMFTDQNIQINDYSKGNRLASYIHFPSDDDAQRITVTDGNIEYLQFQYAEEYGQYEKIIGYHIQGESTIAYRINL